MFYVLAIFYSNCETLHANTHPHTSTHVQREAGVIPASCCSHNPTRDATNDHHRPQPPPEHDTHAK